MNQVTLTGNLAAPPEVRYLTSGKAVASLRLGVTRSWQQDGEWKKETAWVDLVAWGRLAESCADMPTGQGLTITGYLKTEEWEKDGQKRSRNVVVVLEGHRLAPKPRQDSESAPAPATSPAPPARRATAPGAAIPQGNTGDDIPF